MKRLVICAMSFVIAFLLCSCSSLNNQQHDHDDDNGCNHNVVNDKEIPPSCIEDGLSAGSHCSICEKVIVKQRTIEPLGHTTTAGTCERCGESIGIWTEKYFVDEFNDPTYKNYLTTKSRLSGTFSNTATTNSKLTAEIIVTYSYISFILYEYGSQQVKSYSNEKYNITIKCGYSKTTIEGYLTSGQIAVIGSDKKTLLDALASGEKVSFYIENAKYRTSNYLFSVESSNFKDLYDEVI